MEVFHARDVNSLLTPLSSLEKLYCRPQNSWYIAVVEGPAALTRAQLRSSFVCAILGNLLICLIVISILVWYGATGVVVTVVIILMGVGCFPSFFFLPFAHSIWQGIFLGFMLHRPRRNKQDPTCQEMLIALTKKRMI
jgi:formate/nitrite transporter FocA (FNT family)